MRNQELIIPYLTEDLEVDSFSGILVRPQYLVEDARKYLQCKHLEAELSDMKIEAAREGSGLRYKTVVNGAGENVRIEIQRGLYGIKLDEVWRGLVGLGFLPTKGEICWEEDKIEWSAGYDTVERAMRDYAGRSKTWKAHRLARNILLREIAEGGVDRKSVEVALERIVAVEGKAIRRKEFRKNEKDYEIKRSLILPEESEEANYEVLVFEDSLDDDGDVIPHIEEVEKEGFRITNVSADFYLGGSINLHFPDRKSWDYGQIGLVKKGKLERSDILKDAIERSKRIIREFGTPLEVY